MRRSLVEIRSYRAIKVNIYISYGYVFFGDSCVANQCDYLIDPNYVEPEVENLAVPVAQMVIYVPLSVEPVITVPSHVER